MKKKIIVSIAFLSISLLTGWKNPLSGIKNPLAGTTTASTTQGLVNWGTHSTTTTKLNLFISALRETYCATKKVSSVTGLVQSCNQEKTQLTQNFPQTDVQEVKNQAQHNNGLVAALRSASDLGNPENHFIKNRLKHVRNSLANVFGDEFGGAGKTPVIGICASGGGYRAMIGTFGLYEGYAEASVMDTITYASCLSGSTWATFPLALGAPMAALKEGYKKYAVGLKVNPMDKNPIIVPQRGVYPVGFQYKVPGTNEYAYQQYNYFDEKQTIEDNSMRMFQWHQPWGLVNYYGQMIAHVVCSPFDDPAIYQKYQNHSNYPKQARQQMLASQIPNFIQDGTRFPMPIGTMASPISSSQAKTQKVAAQPYIIAEVTPYEVGFDYYYDGVMTGAYVPTWASGRQFGDNQSWTSWATSSGNQKYESKNNAPEYSMSTFLGIFGSAWAASVKDGIRVYFGVDSNAEGSTGVMGKVIDYIAKMPVVGPMMPGLNTRIFPAELPNYAVAKGSPFYGQDYWTVVDAGVAGNIPFYPLMRQARGVDIMIAFDASDNVSEGDVNLSIAEDLARARNIPFPIIKNSPEYAKRHTQWVTVFDQYPPGQSGPIVINLSLIDYPEDYTDANGQHPTFSLADCFKSQCQTSKFAYTPEAIDGLSGLGAAIAKASVPHIKAAVQKAMQGHTKPVMHGYLGTQLRRLKAKLLGRAA